MWLPIPLPGGCLWGSLITTSQTWGAKLSISFTVESGNQQTAFCECGFALKSKCHSLFWRFPIFKERYRRTGERSRVNRSSKWSTRPRGTGVCVCVLSSNNIQISWLETRNWLRSDCPKVMIWTQPQGSLFYRVANQQRRFPMTPQ